jgi:hypothetical protein
MTTARKTTPVALERLGAELTELGGKLVGELTELGGKLVGAHALVRSTVGGAASNAALWVL